MTSWGRPIKKETAPVNITTAQYNIQYNNILCVTAMILYLTVMATTGRLELPTPGLGNLCSVLLSYVASYPRRLGFIHAIVRVIDADECRAFR